jgi:hypothetical protein
MRLQTKHNTTAVTHLTTQTLTFSTLIIIKLYSLYTFRLVAERDQAMRFQNEHGATVTHLTTQLTIARDGASRTNALLAALRVEHDKLGEAKAQTESKCLVIQDECLQVQVGSFYTHASVC